LAGFIEKKSNILLTLENISTNIAFISHSMEERK